MLEQLTRYYVPLKDDMTKFEELCEKKGLKKKDLSIIFEHIDIRQDVSIELQKAREKANKIKVVSPKKKKNKKGNVESLMWMSIFTSAASMIATVLVILLTVFG